MSTNDVPGAKEENADTLHVGCWAEHEDGSLIFVYSTEGARVVFSIFDLDQDPPKDYRTAMDEAAFKKAFSWPDSGVLWTWHDKTPFPWDKVIQAGVREAAKPSSVHDELSAAALTIESLSKHGLEVEGEPIDAEKLAHLKRAIYAKPSAKTIADRIQTAIDTMDAPGARKALADLRALEE